MKRVLSVGVLLVAVASLAFGQATAPKAAKASSVEETLMQIERDWTAALIKADVAAVERIQAPDWPLTDEYGELKTRAQSNAELKSGDQKYQSSVINDLKVRVFGDTAIVHGLSTDKSRFKGKDTSSQYRWTDVFVKREGRWQAVATHVSRVAKR